VSDRARPPEKIELPLIGQQPAEGRPAFREPYFISLQKQRQLAQQAFESQRRNDRVQRIVNIQKTRQSKVIVYFSVGMIVPPHAKMFAELLQAIGVQDNLDLFLVSPGGLVDPALKIAKLCRAHAKSKFSVIVPHYAKSAATLLALGADELVMGPPSELGPIDPRITVKDNYGRQVNVSATAIRDALKVIEEFCGDSPERALKYMPLIESINLDTLGEYERALAASKQYAEELLKGSRLITDSSKTPEVVSKLADKYRSHGYPISARAARDEFFMNVIDPDREAWTSIWQLYNLYEALVEESRTAEGIIATVYEAEEFVICENMVFKGPSRDNS
jgi:hypothetical protein